MSATELVSVIIPNWNGKRFLADCLNSLASQTYPSLEIVVVDNGSTDGSVELLKTSYPWVKLIGFDHNTGFSVAVNAGIRQSNGKFVALLNNDTVVDSDWLAESVKALTEHPEAGSVACKMLSYDDKTILDGAGDGYRRGGLPGRIGHREKDTGQFDQPRYVLGACGGAALYRRELFKRIGLFDEDYFAYLEDVDLGLRAQAAGYKCYYVPTAIVYHLGCGTTGSGYSPLVVRLSAQNNINTIVKNIPTRLFLKFLPQIVYWQSFYLAVVIIRGGQMLPWLQGIFSSVLLFPKMLKKRQEIERLRAVPDDYLEKIIVLSEKDLLDSKQRLHAQVRQSNERISSEGTSVSRVSSNQS
jgi:GT2 family glycosyltransferase